jgi:uncharacterized protein YqjF (DUF2071 family)
MRMWWDELAFLHWSYDPDVVQALLPRGLTVETFDGRAWVGLVPFLLRVTPPRTRPVPWLGVFPETNVRTYVVGPNGEAGVWFFSLDAARLLAVLGARLTYNLPYMWSQMRVEHRGDRITYETRRRWGSHGGRPRHPTSRVALRIGEPFRSDELTDLDHWLTARWAMWFTPLGRKLWSRADHPAWPFHRAEVLELDDQLVTASGLSAPEGVPYVHWSASLEVRIGAPRLR